MSVVPAQFCPTPRELDDLELLLNGGLAPLTAFEADGPVSLTVPAEIDSDDLELVDPEGLPLARLTGAGLTQLAVPAYGPFRRLHLTPAAVAEQHPGALTVPVAAPLTDTDLDTIRSRRGDRSVVLLALTGTGTPQGVTAVGLVRASLAAADLLGDTAVVAATLPSHGDPETDHALGQQVTANYAPGEVLAVSGTGSLPAEVEAVVASDQPDQPGVVVFFTGLSGSGKSTLAQALLDLVLEQGERTVTSLDGDVVRRNLSAGLSFSKADRETNIRRIGWVAAEIARHRGIAICSPIAPFDETRRQVRAMVEEAGGEFVLVHVATPLEECERRDRKGLYAKARAGEIPEFTGISSPYEEPEDAAVRVDTTGRSIEDALADVLSVLPL
ncbi:adenylyl-sulfate kinase [Nocardioides marmoriginsengisoli]|uniref:Adenylyl-sulfate kinase n=1 Tax=Nocardioides marmoriginsengisoli TaxID=661483 RepID=A0A3N0CRS3_9ACTN|nr:adenylyl-sulfate kinase [Nocardioides marmoriginsengisoli]RNL66100.1 adenylyl-sulfate kinase [Nocardioides marmoriginsengisoli]